MGYRPENREAADLPTAITLQVDPAYGYGWISCSTGNSVEEPPPFELAGLVDGSDGSFSMRGRVDKPGHLLDRLWVTLTQRHAEWDGVCNLTASGEEPKSADQEPDHPAYLGYATVPAAS